jgi:hypothetical protein
MYAKSKGVMFEPVAPTHHELVCDVRERVATLTRRVVVDAFLASLTSRRLDWRSALGSYSVFQHLPSHVANGGECAVCGAHDGPDTTDLNVLNFERLKWGGVRHAQPSYASLDLRLFAGDPPPQYTKSDAEVFRAIVTAIRGAGTGVTSANVQSLFAGSLRSNKSERDTLVAILGYCSILEAPAHRGFADSFVPCSARELPARRFVDMPYPACWWSTSVGINESMLQEHFAHVL